MNQRARSKLPTAALLSTSLIVLATSTSCGGDDGSGGACVDGERSLALLEPADGAMLTMADDLDPAMGGLQVQVTVASCGFDFDEQIGIYLLDPVETVYAFVGAGSTGTASTIVPLIPGTLRMQARSMDEAITSGTITFDVSLD